MDDRRWTSILRPCAVSSHSLIHFCLRSRFISRSLFPSNLITSGESSEIHMRTCHRTNCQFSTRLTVFLLRLRVFLERPEKKKTFQEMKVCLEIGDDDDDERKHLENNFIAFSLSVPTGCFDFCEVRTSS